MNRRFLVPTGIIAAVLGVQGAWAQDAAPETQEAVSESPQGNLEEIVVTAQRREESTQRAAIAIAALSPQKIAGVTDVTGLSKLVPAVQFSASQSADPLVYIRGVGSLAGNSLTEPAVTFGYDGVPVARTYHTAGLLFDLARVEVLKGPQGTLYGRNATGGAVNLILRRPQLGELGFDVGVEVGNYNRFSVDGAVNLPLGDAVALRLSGQRVKRDGYYSDGAGDQDTISGRAQVLFQPVGSNLSFNLGVDYSRQRGIGPGGVSLAGETINAAAGSIMAPGFPASERVGAGDPRLAPIYATNLMFYDPAKRRNDNHNWGVTGNLEWATDIGTLTVIPAYREAKLDYYALGGFGIDDKEKDQQTSVEIRFASNKDSRFSWIVGGYYMKEVNEAAFLADAANPPPSFGPASPFSFTNLNTWRLETETKAIFADGTFNVTDNLRVFGGIRYTIENKSADGVHLSDGPVAPVNPSNPIFLNDSLTFKAATWRAGAQWDIADRSMVYASVSRGFHSGGFFFTHDDPIYKPEFLTAYTLGTKNELMDRRLRVNIEAFYWRYVDQQISHITFDSVGSVVFATQNVGAVDIKGLEFEGEFLATPNTLLTANVQYLDSKYDEFTFVQAFIPPNTGCPSSPGPIYVVNCAGRRPPLAPKWTMNLGVQQTIPLSSGASFVVNLRTHYQSDTQTTVEDVPVGLQPAYWLSDASITYNSPNKALSVTAFIDNITDETILATTFANPFSGAIPGSPPLYFGQLQAPRTYGLRLRANF